ncbi:Cytochrome c, s I [Pseudomonas caricapapayae]|uniref:Cytochrome c, s I n=1 Tax=Pseudomonas caricapapayae TaxID=46678 RepID=A0A3M6F1I9_9PSED|nr:cytochrome c [Pseudomonas caricapapayae]RMV74429.1 Cytochrome c, s I [Pseudomonas caricapapayae]
MKMLMLLGILLSGVPAYAAQLNLALEPESSSKVLQSEALLKHPLAQTITVPDDVSYKRDMVYRAVPLASLLTGIKPEDHLQIVALDGFAAELSAAPLLSAQRARAWLAIEDPSEPWPALPGRQQSAGPFYVVWTNPQAGGVGPEQWPFEVSSIKRIALLSERFPALLPSPELKADDPVNKGFALFQKNCLACHRINGAGDAQVGPDLNIPYSPIEYFGVDVLKRYIRNPQSLRQWPQAKMPGFSSDVLPDEDLDLLLSYLKHMSGRKVQP